MYPIINLESTDSTNAYAAGLVSQYEGTSYVVQAQEQSCGRGQKGNKWHSESGKNLLFSLVVYPDFLEADSQFLLNKVVALAVKRTIENSINTDVSIKWPNDIYVGHKKLAGILIENAVCNNKLSHSIIGVGINVNQSEFPSNLPNPVSMINVIGDEININQLMSTFLNTFDDLYSKLIIDKVDDINKDYLDSLFRFGTEGKFILKNVHINAKIINVDKYGRLILTDQNNNEIVCDFKEIQFVI